jgi:molecular chaperone GrpE
VEAFGWFLDQPNGSTEHQIHAKGIGGKMTTGNTSEGSEGKVPKDAEGVDQDAFFTQEQDEFAKGNGPYNDGGEGDSQSLDDDDSPEALIQELEQQLVEFRSRELKAAAELENFRRRTMRDVEQQLKYASVPLVTDLLEVLDNLNRAIDSAVPGAGSDGLVAGVKMVQQQFVNVLSKHHCKQIPGVGQPFDPNVHQAISQMPSSQYPAGSVMIEHSVGYAMHDRVVRPSMVVVSTGSASS